MHTLTPFTRLTRHLGLDAATLSDDERQRLLAALSTATDSLERITGRWLLPRLLTVTLTPLARDPQAVALPHDLLEVLSVTDDGQTVPLDALEHMTDGLLRRTDGDAFRADAVTVRALWAYHPEAARAWRDSGTVTTSTLGTLSPGAVTINGVTGTDTLGQSPRFDVGQLIRLHDELMVLVDINTPLHTLNFMRAVNGSAAAHHDIGTSIGLYTPPPALESMALRWAAWLYRQPDRPEQTHAPVDLTDEVRLWARLRVS